MVDNVYASYAVLTLGVIAAYVAFCKRAIRKELTDGVGFEPTVRDYRTHTFQARLANWLNEHRRSISAVTCTLLRSLRSETRPKTAPSRIHFVYCAPPGAHNIPLSPECSRELENLLRRQALEWAKSGDVRVWN